MKVLVWNLGVAWGRWRGDVALHERAWQWIAAVDPDIALLQETMPPDWATNRWSIEVLPHGLSDHAPMLFDVDIAPKLAEVLADRVPDAIEG